MSRLLTAEDFVAHVGKTFSPKGQHRVLTLVEMKTSEWPGWDAMPRKPFSLILSGPPDDVLPEGLYDVAVDGGPDFAQDFALYIIPVFTPARDRQDYQVVFN
jgi:hypothetical protein